MDREHTTFALPGSEPLQIIAGETDNSFAKAASRDEIVSLSIHVGREDRAGFDSTLAEILGQPALRRRHLKTAEIGERFGASQDTIDRVAETMGRLGFEVGETDAAGAVVEVRGAFGALSEAFRVEPHSHAGPFGQVRSHRGPIHLPSELRGRVEAVLGLDDHPVGRPHCAVDGPPAQHPVDPLEVAEIYRFPAADGAGQKVAIIELGGGFNPEDLEKFCTLSGVPKPRVQDHEVAGGDNRPADNASVAAALEANGLTTRHREPSSIDQAPAGSSSITDVLWTIETSLDLELVSAFVPRAEINLYFAPNNSRGKIAAMKAALDDENSVVSISFGARERGVNSNFVQQMELLLKRAALQGVTVCCASGDGGYLEYPASSPYATACGGTSLHGADGTVVRETVWNEAVPAPTARLMVSSGGVSTLFDLPEWQRTAEVQTKTGVTMRGVPDVSAKADLVSGYRIVAGGVIFATGGTSAAAPLWAGLTARLNQRLGEHATTAGHLPSLLYRDGWSAALNDIANGRSGAYRACSGWDPCTGLGSPDGAKLLEKIMTER